MMNVIEAITAIASVAKVKSVSDELGFSYPDVLEAIRLCTTSKIAVLGVEVFHVRGDFFDTIKMSGYELPDPSKDWLAYVEANNSLADEFCRFNPTGDDHVYVLTSSSWREFCQVQEVKKEREEKKIR